MTEWDRDAWETALIADLRAHDGLVTSGPLAEQRLLIMTSTGVKSGTPRRAILTFSRDGDAYVVAGSNNGRQNDPAWLHNVTANAEVTVEADARIFVARASIAEGADRDRLWAAHVAALPHFADYPAQSGRAIPMVRLTPVG